MGMNGLGALVDGVRLRFEAGGVAVLNSTTGKIIADSGECDAALDWISAHGGSLPPWPFTSSIEGPARQRKKVVASPAGRQDQHLWLLIIEPGDGLVQSEDWADVLESLARHARRLQVSS